MEIESDVEINENLTIEEQLDYIFNWNKKWCEYLVAGVLDLRDISKFNELHFLNTTHFDFSARSARELPPRGAKFIVFGDTIENINGGLKELKRLGFFVVKAFTLSVDVFDKVDKSLLTSGYHQQIVLWKPSPCLGEFVDEVESHLLNQKKEGIVLKAMDIACGTGRDAIFLALRDWEVYAFDYLDKQLSYALDFATKNSVTERVHFILRDVEANGLPTDIGKFHLINVARYLYRPLFPQIVDLLEIGGFVVYHTFMRGSENTLIGRPRRALFLLELGELKSIFQSFNFEILHDDVHILPDGRPTSFFVARKVK